MEELRVDYYLYSGVEEFKKIFPLLKLTHVLLVNQVSNVARCYYLRCDCTCDFEIKTNWINNLVFISCFMFIFVMFRKTSLSFYFSPSKLIKRSPSCLHSRKASHVKVSQAVRKSRVVRAVQWTLANKIRCTVQIHHFWYHLSWSMMLSASAVNIMA